MSPAADRPRNPKAKSKEKRPGGAGTGGPKVGARAGGPGRAPARPSPGRPAWLGPNTLAALGLALATLILFRDVMLGGLTFLSPDALAPLGFSRIGERALFHQGIYPLWNPYVFCGMPSFASLAFNPFIYPPDWPLRLLNSLLPLPDLTWLILYYFVGGFGLFLLCREWGVRSWGAFLGGLAFLSTPNLVAVGAHGHGSQLVDSAFVPWLLWLAARVFRRGSATDVAWLALGAGMQLLRGHVQVCYYTWLALALYALFELALPGEGRPALRARLFRAGGVVLGMGLGLALASFLYLPVHDYARYSIRGGGAGGGVGLDYATQWSFSPIELLTFLVPGAVGFGGPTYWGSMPFTDYPNYMGLGILGLALVGAVRARRPLAVSFLIALFGLAVLVAFGKHGFLYPFLYDHLPQFNKFRVPVMILLLAQLAVACLAAMGADAAIEARTAEGGATLRTWRAVLVAGAIAAIVLLLGLAPSLWRDALAGLARAMRPTMAPADLQAALAGAQADAARVGILALVSLAAAWLTMRRLIPVGTFVSVLVAATVFDLWSIDQRIMQPVLGPPAAAEAAGERDDVIDFLTLKADSAAAAGQQIRILPLDPSEFQSNRYAGFGIASFGGYHAAKPKIAQEAIAAQAHLTPFLEMEAGRGWGRAGFLNAADIDYVLLSPRMGLMPPGTPLELVHQGAQAVYRNPAAVPRATLVYAAERMPVERHLDRLVSPGYDPRGSVLLEPGAPATALGPPGGSVRITRYGLNSVDMEAQTPGPAWLRFTDLYFPDWRVKIDGRPERLYRADFEFRAVLLPAGRHRVEWSYESRALRLGLILTGVALVCIAVLFVAGRRRRVS